MKVMVGDSVPLSYSTSLATAGLTVLAHIIDCFGVDHGVVPVPEVSKGVYASKDFKMPDVPFVVVVYHCDDEKFESPSEKFVSTPKPGEPVKFVEGIVTKRSAGDFIVGEVINARPHQR